MKKDTRETVAAVVGCVAGAGAAGLIGGIGVTFVSRTAIPKALKPVYYLGAVGIGGAAGVAADKYVTDATEAVLEVADDVFELLGGEYEEKEPDPLEEAEAELVSVKVPKEAWEKFQAMKAAKAERNGIIESSSN